MYAYGALTNGLEGKELAEIGLLAESGAVAFTDADHPIGNAKVLRRALDYAKAFDALIVHLPQEPTLSGGHMTSGEIATRLGLAGNPPLAESDAGRARHPAGRDDRRASASGQDLPPRPSRRSRRQGARLKITCDTAAPYFALNDLAVGDYRTFGKLVPPLRAEKDRLAVVEGLKNGTIDAIVSDHRPQDQDSKRVPFAQAEPGGSGWKPCCRSRSSWCTTAISPCRGSSSSAATPARLFGLPGGRLAKGAPADLVVFDADYAWKVDRDQLWSKTKNTPFDERPVQGRVMATIVGGRTIYRDDSFVTAARAA